MSNYRETRQELEIRDIQGRGFQERGALGKLWVLLAATAHAVADWAAHGGRTARCAVSGKHDWKPLILGPGSLTPRVLDYHCTACYALLSNKHR